MNSHGQKWQKLNQQSLGFVVHYTQLQIAPSPPPMPISTWCRLENGHNSKTMKSNCPCSLHIGST